MTPAPRIDELLTGTSARAGRSPALRHGEEKLTYRQLEHAARRLAGVLDAQPGEAVVVAAPNVPALVVGMFAAWCAGAVAVPLSARLRTFELERALADARPVAVLSIAAHGGFRLGEVLARLSAATRTARRFVLVDHLGAVLEEQSLRPSSAARRVEESLACVLYTSGTTGEPKGALVTHSLATAAARNLAELLGEHAGSPYGLPVPASHAFGLACLLCGIASAAPATMLDGAASARELVRLLRDRRAEVLHGSPTVFAGLLRAEGPVQVRTGFTAGSSCPPEVLAALDERGTKILNLYGMSEIGAATCCRSADPPEVRHRTVGRPLPGYELRIADGAGEPAREGEVEVRSPLLADGYLGRPWSASERDADGWFRTGDLGSLDVAGNLTLAGRIREVVHVGGFNVFPAEVESFLLGHPAIEQAAVVGVGHPVHGEALHAFVAPASGVELQARDVIAFARQGIAGYKVPYSVSVMAELPLLASGKPDRRTLAATLTPSDSAEPARGTVLR